MIIITWNANAVNRWDQLWNEKLVQTLGWDVICLQEVGNPRPEWTQVEGPDWGVSTSQAFQIRKYSYTTPFGLPLYITHCEWTKHQKNHLVMITRTLPAWATNLSGDMGERPCFGIKARLHFRWPQEDHMDVFIGCVHIISSYKSPAETTAMLQYVDTMTQVKGCLGWVLFGDFNANPSDMKQATNRHVVAFNGWTQKNQQAYPLDYLLANGDYITSTPYYQWEPGTAMSDHRLMMYYQLGGPKVEIL